MKIREVRAYPLQANIADSGWEGQIDDNLNTLIQVVTDEGVWGIGSVYTGLTLVEGALKVLNGFLIGEEATEPQRISEKLHQSTFWQGRGGAITHTISGIDMALWDIAGKTANQPVGRLLGGMYRHKVRAYGSILFDEPERLRETMAAALDKGFKSIKLGWYTFGRRDRSNDERLVRAAREIAGPDIELMIDAGGSEQYWPNGLKWALETARMLGEYDIAWFEEPLAPDLIDDYVKLREASPVRISCGEVLTRRQSFAPWLERGAVDVIQPDNTKCGGLSESTRIGWTANDRGIPLIAHGWNTAVGLAADLALAAALPLTDRVEYITPSPYIEEIVSTPFRLDADGCLEIPLLPGLGIALDPDGISRLSGRTFDTFGEY